MAETEPDSLGAGEDSSSSEVVQIYRQPLWRNGVQYFVLETLPQGHRCSRYTLIGLESGLCERVWWRPFGCGPDDPRRESYRRRKERAARQTFVCGTVYHASSSIRRIDDLGDDRDAAERLDGLHLSKDRREDS